MFLGSLCSQNIQNQTFHAKFEIPASLLEPLDTIYQSKAIKVIFVAYYLKIFGFHVDIHILIHINKCME